MITVDSANSAVRLDPTLRPPNGATIRFLCKINQRLEHQQVYYGPPTVIGWLPFSDQIQVKCGRGITALIFKVAGPFEIVTLPDDCPPMDEWPRGSGMTTRVIL